jgi:hypothetical protein
VSVGTWQLTRQFHPPGDQPWDDLPSRVTEDDILCQSYVRYLAVILRSSHLHDIVFRAAHVKLW